jgi:hypothetical protein
MSGSHVLNLAARLSGHITKWTPQNLGDYWLVSELSSLEQVGLLISAHRLCPLA